MLERLSDSTTEAKSFETTKHTAKSLTAESFSSATFWRVQLIFFLVVFTTKDKVYVASSKRLLNIQSTAFFCTTINSFAVFISSII